MLLHSDGNVDDRLGNFVSLSGNSVLAGAFTKEVGANDQQGSAYVFREVANATGNATEDARLLALTGNTGDRFGTSVSLSGTTALVGAPNADGPFTNQGWAYLFRNLDTATGNTTQNATLRASDGATNDNFGTAVSLSGAIGLVGAPRDDVTFTDQGSAHLFRNLDTATGNVTEIAKLTASDGAASDFFGSSLSLSGTIGLVGAFGDDFPSQPNRGSAYVFRNLHTATGNITENAKLTASDGASNDEFGVSVAIHGPTGLVGAHRHNSSQGAAYLFRNLDTASGNITENAKLTASDGAANHFFGISVAVWNDLALVGARRASEIIPERGAVYLFTNLATANGTILETVKIFPSLQVGSTEFGISVALEGDFFAVGISNLGLNSSLNVGAVRTGRVHTFLSADNGDDATSTDGLSFKHRDDWNIGVLTSNNTVTISSGDLGNVTRSGKVVWVGRESSSNNNLLSISMNAILQANQVNIGNGTNSGNQLRLAGTLELTSSGVVNLNPNSILSGNGVVQGGSTVNVLGSLRPGVGGIGFLTLNGSSLTWNGGGSPWVFELGSPSLTLSSAFSSNLTQDWVRILSGNFTKGTGTGFQFDFAGTGAEGWYKLVSWSGTTNFDASDFSGFNLAGNLTVGSFVIDNATKALYVNVVPEPTILGLLSLGLSGLLARRLLAASKKQGT